MAHVSQRKTTRLSEAHLHPNSVARISIGANNSALIAGNPREERVDKLRKFRELVTMSPLWGVKRISAVGMLQPPRDQPSQTAETAYQRPW
jgi:hypothetical protein